MNEQRITGLIVLTIGLLTIFILIPIGIVSPRDVNNFALAPEFWPMIVAVTFSVMGLILTIRPIRREGEEVTEVTIEWKQRIPRIAMVLAVLFGFYYLAPFLGMVVTGTLLILILTWFAGERRWLLMTGLAILVPVTLYLFFYYVASIPIPLGIFEQIF